MSIVTLAQLAYFLTFASFAVRNVQWLRILAVFAGLAAMYYSFHAADEPLWIPFFWNASFVFLNAVHLALSRWRSRDVRLDPLEEFLAKTVLLNFPKAEVHSFTSLAHEGELAAGAKLIQAGTEIHQLYCLVKGRVDVFAGGEKVSELGPGRFVGEMSLLTHSLTRADVNVAEDIKALVWTHDSIEGWVNGDTSRLGLLQTALGTQIVEELLRQRTEEIAG